MTPTHSRRTLLSGIAAAGALLALAACQSGTPTPAQVAQDAALIAQGLAGVASSLAAVPGIPAATLTKVQGYIAEIQAASAQIATDTTGTVWPTSVQSVATLVGQIADVVLPLVPGGAPFVAVITAAEALVPILLSAAKITAARPGPAGVTPEQARLTLRAAAVGGLH